jgi:hypothetical protein
MSDTSSNGTHKAPFDDGPWEIVHVGGNAWIGKVEAADGDELTLSPCFSYVFQAQQTTQGLQLVRDVIPHEFFVSAVPLRTRWIHRRRLDDFDDADREMLRKLVDRAIQTQKDLRGARSNLTVAATMPKGLQRPG